MNFREGGELKVDNRQIEMTTNQSESERECPNGTNVSQSCTFGIFFNGSPKSKSKLLS